MNKFLQINANKARLAYDLMTQLAIELDIDIIVVTEPNVNRLGKEWTVDNTNIAAIKTTKTGIPFKRKSDEGFTWITHNNITIYSCYISPNVDIDTFQNFLNNLEQSITQHDKKHNMIITGDFNSASTIWGSEHTNRRGNILEEWMSRLNLTVMNQGNRPTFERKEQKSFLDLTLCNEQMVDKITKWTVL